MEYVCGEVLFPGLQNFLLKGDLRYYPAKEKWLQLIENTTIFIAAPQQIQIVFFSEFFIWKRRSRFYQLSDRQRKERGHPSQTRTIQQRRSCSSSRF